MYGLARFVLCIQVLFIFSFMACGTGNTPKDCTQNSDCGQLTCCIKKGEEKGACQEKCETAKSCPSGACQSNDDCLNAAPLCVDGCCKPKPVFKDCKKDGDCDSGQICGGTKCEACTQSCSSSTECSGSDTCDNGCCKERPCSSDDQCKTGNKKYCDKTSKKCVECTDTAQCGDKKACRSGRCSSVECVGDHHCQTQKKPICDPKTYRCVPRKVCETHADCESLYPGGIRNRCDPSANGGLGECKKGHCVECTKDDECGGSGDLCIGKDKGLKDGKRCLASCKENKDCPSGFDCSDSVVQGFKVCFPRVGGFCVDPCKNVTCQPNEKCVVGKCIKQPEVCDVCTTNADCGSGNECLTYSKTAKFCGKKCSVASDCPSGRKFFCFNGQCLAEDECKK